MTNVELIQSHDLGSIVLLTVQADDAEFSITFERRAFGDWYEAWQADGRAPVVAYDPETETLATQPE